jgi:hypothetical protein
VVSHYPIPLSSSSNYPLPQPRLVGTCLIRSPPVSWRHPKPCCTHPPAPASARLRACIRPRLGGCPASLPGTDCELTPTQRRPRATLLAPPRHQLSPLCTLLPADRRPPRCSPLPVISGRTARSSPPPQAASSRLPAAGRNLVPPYHPPRSSGLSAPAQPSTGRRNSARREETRREGEWIMVGWTND